MSNKEVIKEAIWCLSAFLIAYIVAIYTISGPDPLSGLSFFLPVQMEFDPLDYVFTPFTIGKAMFFFFPMLFLVTFTRAVVSKFNKRSLNIFLFFICSVSLAFNFILLQVFEFILPIGGGFTKHTLLSAIPEVIASPYKAITEYSIVGFMAFQLTTMVIVCIKIFNRNPNSI